MTRGMTQHLILQEERSVNSTSTSYLGSCFKSKFLPLDKQRHKSLVNELSMRKRCHILLICYFICVYDSLTYGLVDLTSNYVSERKHACIYIEHST